jgi:hypothetical protein
LLTRQEASAQQEIADSVVWYLKPELALLFKAGQDREKDREDLAVARLTPEARQWLTATLEKLGHAEWAKLARQES